MEENQIPPVAPVDPKTQESVEDAPVFHRNRVQDLFVWKSLNRPEWQYSKDVYTTLGVVAILVSIIAAFFQEWMAIVLIGAAYFLFYALSKHPSTEVEHKITTEGIVYMGSVQNGTQGKVYLWANLGSFWFTQKEADKFCLLHIANNLSIFDHILMLVDKQDKEKIIDILAEYLPFVEVPQKSISERLSDWFARKFPIEKMVTQNFKAPQANPPVPPAPPQTPSTV